MLPDSTLSQLSALTDAAEVAVSNATRGGFSSGDVSNARDALNAFWKVQTTVQNGADPGYQSAAINSMNSRVHAAWGRLEAFLAQFDPDVSTWQTHAKTAQEAFSDAANLAQAAQASSRLVSSLQAQSASAPSIPSVAAANYIDTSYTGALKRQFGVKTDTMSETRGWLPGVVDTLSQSFLGIPVWGWGALALGGIFFLTRRR
jgi:hypothetical protein